MNKVIEISKLNNLRNLLKKNNKKIILCHGVFDLVHIGHLDYFKSSKKHGDVLIVSVTKDKFVNKGPNRPYNKDKDRVKFLSSLEIVDYVILNTAPTAVNIIKKIKPNIYCKGPDYKNHDEDITGKINEEEHINQVPAKSVSLV